MKRLVRKMYNSPRAEAMAVWGQNHFKLIEGMTYDGDPVVDNAVKNVLCNISYPGFRMFRGATQNIVRATTAEVETPAVIEFVPNYYLCLNAIDINGNIRGILLSLINDLQNWTFYPIEDVPDPLNYLDGCSAYDEEVGQTFGIFEEINPAPKADDRMIFEKEDSPTSSRNYTQETAAYPSGRDTYIGLYLPSTGEMVTGMSMLCETNIYGTGHGFLFPEDMSTYAYDFKYPSYTRQFLSFSDFMSHGTWTRDISTETDSLYRVLHWTETDPIVTFNLNKLNSQLSVFPDLFPVTGSIHYYVTNITSSFIYNGTSLVLPNRYERDPRGSHGWKVSENYSTYLMGSVYSPENLIQYTLKEYITKNGAAGMWLFLNITDPETYMRNNFLTININGSDHEIRSSDYPDGEYYSNMAYPSPYNLEESWNVVYSIAINGGTTISPISKYEVGVVNNQIGIVNKEWDMIGSSSGMPLYDTIEGVGQVFFDVTRYRIVRPTQEI